MNVKTRPAYAPEFRRQIIELYASGQIPSESAREFGCSEASIHAWVKKAGTLRSLPDGGKAVKAVHRQAHQVQVAMAQSADERDELLRLRKDNKRLRTAAGHTCKLIGVNARPGLPGRACTLPRRLHAHESGKSGRRTTPGTGPHLPHPHACQSSQSFCQWLLRMA